MNLNLILEQGFVVIVFASTTGLAASCRDAAGQIPERAGSGTATSAPQATLESDAVVRIAQLTNALRASEGLPKLTTNPKLTAAARYLAEYMAETGKYGHMADGTHPKERASEYGYEACLVGENIGRQFSTRGFSSAALASRFVEAWKNSKEHRENMLDPDMMDTAVAVAKDEKSGLYYAVQLFGRPKSQSIIIEVANRSGVDVEYELGDQSIHLEPNSTSWHEQCRPTDLTFSLPAPDGTTRTVTEHVPASARLVVQVGPSKKLIVSRSPGRSVTR